MRRESNNTTQLYAAFSKRDNVQGPRSATPRQTFVRSRTHLYKVTTQRKARHTRRTQPYRIAKKSHKVPRNVLPVRDMTL